MKHLAVPNHVVLSVAFKGASVAQILEAATEMCMPVVASVVGQLAEFAWAFRARVFQVCRRGGGR